MASSSKTMGWFLLLLLLPASLINLPNVMACGYSGCNAGPSLRSRHPPHPNPRHPQPSNPPVFINPPPVSTSPPATPYPGSGGVPAPSDFPPPSTPSGTKCSINILKLGLCLDVLGGLLHTGLGDAVAHTCCPVLGGLLEVDAAACLCTAIKLKLLDLDIYIPIALNVLLTCGKSPPAGYICPMNNELKPPYP